MKRHILATTALTLALMSAVPALAAEGMWLPNQTKGIAPALKEAGLKLDTTELGNLQVAPFNAIVSLGGCSAAFLSPEGLVATNHHCVYGSIQYNSKPGQDYLTDGFLAKAKSDEVPAAPGSRIFVIEDLRDVTAEMNKGLKAKMTGLQRFEAMEANRKGLVDACEKQPNRRCDVRAYFGGAVYYLQQQLEIKDVRLVYAPAGGIGNYGGETDNWQWPRHTGDFGFYRAYVSPTGESAEFSKDNVPYKPKAWLTIAKEPLRENDYVMVAGFPGTTSRLVTAAEAKFNFEKVYPLNQRLLAEYSDAIMKATQGDQAAQIKYASILKGSDNYKKKLLGEMAGADAINLAAVKDAEEAAFRAWVKADPKREKQYAADIAALDALIADGQTRTLANMKKGLLNRSQLLGNARTLYRWAKEQAKPEDKREAGFRPKDRSGVVARLAAMERRFDAKVDRVLFEQALAEYNTLAADQRDAAFEAKLKELGVDRLYAETKLTDSKARAALL
ncbi:MAG: S46 family peptidase, partial [Asticcacaulis sp.]